MADFTIRPADLEADRDVLVASLLEHLTARSTERRYRWFYEENPHGRAQAWIATEGTLGRVIGSGAIIPRAVYVDGSIKQAVVMADFWIHPDFRSLGPAVKLQRACIDGAAASGFAFFDLPQGKMPAVYQRLRLLDRARLVALTKPLRAQPYLRRLGGNNVVTRAASFACDQLLRYWDRSRTTGSCTVARHDGPLGTEFSDLGVAASARYGTCVARSADYLTWRYRSHYYLRYDFYTARHEGRLLAYAVVVASADHADIVDIFGSHEPQVVTDLILGVAETCRANGQAALTLALHASDGWIDLLSRAGLRKRSERPFVIREFEENGSTAGKEPSREWFLSYGDIDY